jgi:checkpoint serine/threonine-protein kinase
VFIPHAVIFPLFNSSTMDIDVSKENIQPLRGGRNLVQLGTALQAQSDVDAQKQLQQQKE